MRHVQKYARFLTVTLGLLWSAAGCSSTASESGGKGENGSGGKSASGGSGGKASGGAGGSIVGAGGKSDTGGSAGGSGGKPGSAGSGGISGGAGGPGGKGGSGGASSGGAGGRITGPGGWDAGGVDAGRLGGNGGRVDAGGTMVGGAGGQANNDPGSGPTTITGLKIDDNPKNVLSAFVSWTTDKPGNSVVQFGQGKYEWEISDAALVTSHKVLIIGMVASKAYQIKAMSSNGGTSVSATGNYTTKALPSQIPVATVKVNDTTKTQPGWTLMNILKATSPSAPISNDPSMAVIYDATGQPVWYYINGTSKEYGGATATYLTDKGVLIGPVYGANGSSGESPREVDFAGNTVWECKDPKCGGTGQLTHDTIKLSNGNHVVLRWKETTSGMTTDTDAAFEEIDSSGKVVWSVVFGDLVPKPSGASGDWCHGNSITVDIAKDTVYINCRFMGMLKTSYKNPKQLLWYLPASYYSNATGNMAFSPTTARYSDTHDPEIHDDGTILVFDNGGYSTSMFGSSTTYHSRAVEYKIDETAKTATLVWEFPGSFDVDSWYKNNWYTSYFGDADRLPNGNVLITAGSLSSNNGDARVFEVQKADGKVVWEFGLPSGYGTYRAERIVPPLVKAVTQ